MVEGVGGELRPTKFGIKSFGESRVYPDTRPDPYGQVNTSDQDRSRMGGSADIANEDHYRADTDSSQRSLHHTLGISRNQASPGSHTHDGLTSPLIGPSEPNPSFNPNLTPSDTNQKNRPAWTCAATASDIRALLHKFVNFRDV